MPVSPIGNMNFVNQNMAYPATQASNELAKEGFASLINMAEFNDKEKMIQKLEKVNESAEIKEEIKEKNEEEKKKKHEKNEKNEEEGEENELSSDDLENLDENLEENLEKSPNFKDAQSIHHLDISI